MIIKVSGPVVENEKTYSIHELDQHKIYRVVGHSNNNFYKLVTGESWGDSEILTLVCIASGTFRKCNFEAKNWKFIPVVGSVIVQFDNDELN